MVLTASVSSAGAPTVTVAGDAVTPLKVRVRPGSASATTLDALLRGVVSPSSRYFASLPGFVSVASGADRPVPEALKPAASPVLRVERMSLSPTTAANTGEPLLLLIADATSAIFAFAGIATSTGSVVESVSSSVSVVADVLSVHV